jgi:hypothetical protein
MLYTKTKTISTTAHVAKIKKTNYYNFLKKSSFFMFPALFLAKEREQETIPHSAFKV